MKYLNQNQYAWNKAILRAKKSNPFGHKSTAPSCRPLPSAEIISPTNAAATRFHHITTSVGSPAPTYTIITSNSPIAERSYVVPDSVD